MDNSCSVYRHLEIFVTVNPRCVLRRVYIWKCIVSFSRHLAEHCSRVCNTNVFSFPRTWLEPASFSSLSSFSSFSPPLPLLSSPPLAELKSIPPFSIYFFSLIDRFLLFSTTGWKLLTFSIDYQDFVLDDLPLRWVFAHLRLVIIYLLDNRCSIWK